MNIQYLINVTEDFKIYPQFGYALAFTKTEEYTTYYAGGSSVTVAGDNDTDGGIQLGLGAQYNIGEQSSSIGASLSNFAGDIEDAKGRGLQQV